MSSLRIPVLSLGLLLGWVGFAIAENPSEQSVHFAREILPILSDKCFQCHGPAGKEGLVRLDSFAGATSGGAIDPNALGQSGLIQRIFSKDAPMPPEDAQKQLSDQERKLLAAWVKQGAKYQKHWAYVQPKKPEVPGEGNPIDAFIARQFGKHDFAPEADRATLARRAALTLTGLPPEPERLKEFLSDKRPDAYERYVDELLAKPTYGEHQARYWLDAVRYGDTHGLHLDNRRAIFPYRDWVVRAFNQNLPFDDFITWQLAGDLLPNPTTDQQIATGFVRMNPTTSEGGVIPAEFQAKNNFDRTETLGTVFLGATLTCARCHTHKYDPIQQKEYYELFAFFNSTAERPLDGNSYDYAPLLKLPQMYEKDDEFGVAQTLVAKELPKPRETRMLHRGEYDEPVGDPLQPDVFDVMGPLPADAPRNRLGLAQWLTSREHPLVSRVLINRVWQRVFGEGLVRTPEDFGLQGQQPTHPELLDWLAVEFQDCGWDLKRMIRLMVSSKTFRQSSAIRQELEDPQNKLFARGPRYRLDAEAIRDVALWASGLLIHGTSGPGMKPPQPDGLWSALMHPASNTKKYVADKDQDIYRRSLYIYWKRTCPHPMMTLFDAPSRESSCVRRSRSNTPLQSLALMNEVQRIEMARKLAERLVRQAGDEQQRMDRLFLLLASREPKEIERQACTQLLNQMQARYRASPTDAEALLNLGQAPRDAELDSVEVAAWTQVAVVVLASDITITVY